MGKALRVAYCTKEGKRLFHIGVRFDRSIRILTNQVFLQKLDHSELYLRVEKIETAIANFITFLDNSFLYFSNFENSPGAIGQLPFHLQGIIRSYNESAKRKKIDLNSPSLLPLFRALKSTDLCIRICETYALQYHDRYLKYRTKFQNELEKLDLIKIEVEAKANSLLRNYKKNSILPKK
jgi:hypothetical protein